MRPIKYRAWDKIKSIMRGVVRVDFDNPSFNVQILCPTESAPKNWELRKFDEVELMQFTGLTDKNGKEIYENDVCICPRNGSDCDRSLVVKYGGQCQFYLQEVESEKIFNMPMYSKNIEVIGNIYEHPNLLK